MRKIILAALGLFLTAPAHAGYSNFFFRSASDLTTGTLDPNRVSPSSFTLQGNSVKFSNGSVIFGDGSTQTTAAGVGAQVTFSSISVGPNNLQITGSTDTTLIFKSSGAYIAGPFNSTFNAPTLTTNLNYGLVSWAGTEGNARTQDGLGANMALSNGASTYWLVASSFAFNVPANAVITGIKLYCMAKGTSGNNISWSSARIMQDGVIGSVDDGQGSFGSTYSTLTVSGGGLWSLTWTPQQINSPGFGAVFGFKATSVGQTLNVDWVSIEVTWVIQDWSMGTSRQTGTFQIANSSNPLYRPQAIFQANEVAFTTYTQIGSSVPFPVANTALRVGPDLYVGNNSFVGFKRSTPTAAIDINGQAGTTNPLLEVSTGTSKIFEVSGASVTLGASLAFPDASTLERSPKMRSTIYVSSFSNTGTTNTKIWYMTTSTNGVSGAGVGVFISSGSDMTMTGNQVAGSSIVINTSGWYYIGFNLDLVAQGQLCISVNSTEPTTSINSITVGKRLFCSAGGGAAADWLHTGSGIVYLAVGDVVRLHGDGGNATGATAQTMRYFTMTKVSD